MYFAEFIVKSNIINIVEASHLQFSHHAITIIIKHHFKNSIMNAECNQFHTKPAIWLDQNKTKSKKKLFQDNLAFSC